MGQEAARAVWLLGNSDKDVRQAYDHATGWMHSAPDFLQQGTYCCGRCTLAFWRHTWVRDFELKETYLAKGLQSMREQRLGDGRWRIFPFFYSIYTLSELDLDAAREELKYARPAMEKSLKLSRADIYSKRRAAIFSKVIENLN